MKKSFLWIAVILTCSCNPLKKAQDQFKLHPESFAELSAKQFPCIPNHIVDTTIHIDDTAFHQTVKALEDYIVVLQDSYTQLNDKLQSSGIDSLSRLELIKKQQAAISELQAKINNIKPELRYVPKPYPVRDSAAMQVLQNQIDKLLNQSGDLIAASKDLIAQRDKQKKQKVKYMWWTGGLALSWIIFLLIGYFTRRIKTANKIINAVK